VQRVSHEDCRVVRELHVDVVRERCPDPGHFGVESARHFDLVAADERPDAEVHGLLVAELRDEAGLLGAQLHPGHVGQPHNRSVPLSHDQVLELLRRAQIGVGEQVDLHQVAFGLSHRGEVVVAL
jgi:hypothetical protein